MAARLALQLLPRATPSCSSIAATSSALSSCSLSSAPSSSASSINTFKRPLYHREFYTSVNNDASSSDGSPHKSQPIAEFHTSYQAPFYTQGNNSFKSNKLINNNSTKENRPGSIAFGECEISALSDLFLQFAKSESTVDSLGPYLNHERIKLLLESVGEKPDDDTLQTLFEEINLNKDGKLRLDCFLRAADHILGAAPARVVLVVGGPGSGKGALCERLEKECGAVHLSCGEMLREEVEARTPLGIEVAEIMERGELVSSAVVTALMRRRMRQHPGRRILLDGFPRSLENARDFVELCGPPELALHLDCDDCVLLERILARGGKSAKEAERAKAEGREVVSVRADDNIHTAIQRLKNYHIHHRSTMDWLKHIRVPIVELDCSGSKEDVWGQLMAIGRLMRPAVKIPPVGSSIQQEMGGGGGLTAASEDMQWFA
mmetsp:Transcript_5178/g.11426  ORF Transcript_5178/g.11426 Transcript_5178/m.11426 type:complete len:434 (+) Transcript_5178:204-1505(+)|eukprot:scaffold3337_cov204-Alexandrium_tamarense.AAC.4